MQQATVAGQVGEVTVLTELSRQVSSQGYEDMISRMGNIEGEIACNKTGDIVAVVDFGL